MIAALAALASCGVKNDPEVPVNGVSLSITPTLVQAPETRAAVFGDLSNGNYMMPDGTSFGLFVCEHYDGSYTDGTNPYTPYALNYNNIKAVRTGGRDNVAGDGVWNYTYYTYTNLTELYLKGTDENNDHITDVNADIFAYAPYQASVTTPEYVPFSVASAMDVMYAAQNPDPVANKDIDPGNPAYHVTNPAKVEVPLTFTHALSLLEFCFTLKNPLANHSYVAEPTTENGIQGIGQSYARDYTLDFIKIERTAGAQHPLHVSGVMNAMTGGTLSELQDASSLTVSERALQKHGYSATNYVHVSPSSNPGKAYILQVPSQEGESYQDGDYLISFKFTGQDFPVTFTLLREHLMHADGTTCGFQPGYKYSFNFVIDNYVHFEGITIGEWETIEAPILQKEI